MRIGVVPLTIGVAVAAARLTGAEFTADFLSCLYLIVATLILNRSAQLKPALRV